MAAVALLASCGVPSPSQTPSSSPTSALTRPQTTEPTTPSAPTSPSASASPLDGLSLEQRVGQLFMVGVDAASPGPASRAAVTDRHVGNVFVAGRSSAGAEATAGLVASLTSLVSDATTGGVPMLVATDQEGGNVQVLRGPGFSDIPSALTQGTWDRTRLEEAATTWGSELASAGINLNLAPVMDVVPSPADAKNNPPIGRFDRQFGYAPGDVATAANAFSAGMMSAGVDVAIKHFPGLGRVTANTDTTADVHDTVTTRDDPFVGAFGSGIDAGARFVMMSTAYYDAIDPGAPAAFSPIVVNELLRGQLGFTGVIMTDDVSAAAQAQAWSPADRAVLAIAAGVDLVLASADPSLIPEMVDAVVARARRDPQFAVRVDDAAARVLAAKDRLR